MLFKMLLDKSGDHERPLVRQFLRHLLAGAGIGLLLGACGYGAILISMADNAIDIPLLFALAMLLQAAAVGGLVGGGVFMSRITDRDHDGSSDGDTPPPDGPLSD